MSLRQRAGRILARSGTAAPTEAAQLEAGHVDTCWVLEDGALCVDGWLADAHPGRPVAARLEGSDVWSPLLRKRRPDVTAALNPSTADANHGYGLVGYVAAGPLGGTANAVELRSEAGVWTCALLRPTLGPVRESVFSGVIVEDEDLTPSGLEPIVNVIRHSAMAARPSADTVYAFSGDTQDPWLSVVVPFYGECVYLRNLLMTLATARLSGVEVIAVSDDPSLTPTMAEWLVAWNEVVFRLPMRLLAHDRNAGFAHACNTGWRAAASPAVLLLNSDILIEDAARTLPRLASHLRDGAGATAPVLLFPDGTLQHAGMQLESSTDFPGFVLPAHPGKHEASAPMGPDPFAVPMLSGAALMTTVDMLESVGGVPIVFGKGDFEDVLLSQALSERGALLVDPSVTWTHVEGASYRREEHGGVPLTLAKSVVIGERLAAGV